MNKKVIAVVGTMLSIALGVGVWYLQNRKTIAVIAHPTTANATAALNEQWQKYVNAVTARARSQIDSLDHFYRDSMKVLHKREAQHRGTFTHLLTDTTASDSARLHACSVVVLDCEARAELAESQVTKLGRTVKDLLSLQPSACDLRGTTGPTYVPTGSRKGFSPLGITVGIGCRIPIKLPF